MALTRSPVALTTTPSTSAYEAMAKSQQAHIDDLVQKNRASEITIRKLQQSIQDEKDRALETIRQMKQAAQDEREEWKNGCESLLAGHRLIHLRTRIELDNSRMETLKEQDDVRRERVAVLQRDFNLVMFQGTEATLRDTISQLEDELEELKEQLVESTVSTAARNEQSMTGLNSSIAQLDIQRKKLMDELQALKDEKDALQDEVTESHNRVAELQSSLSAATTKYERATLQVQGLKTAKADLEAANNEFKRQNEDVKQQLERWQSLDTKDSAETDDLRKRRIELELSLKELKARVRELEKSGKETTKLLEQERKKAEKLLGRVEAMSEVAEEAQELAAKSQNESSVLEEELKEAREAIAKLQDHLRNEKAYSQALREELISRSSPSKTFEIGSEKEVEIAVTPMVALKTRPKSAHRIKSLQIPNGQPKEKLGTMSEKAKGKQRAIEPEEEIEEGSHATQSVAEGEISKEGGRKGKGKQRSAHDSGLEDISENRAPMNKGKRKAIHNSDAEDSQRDRKVAKPSSRSAQSDGKRRGRPASTSGTRGSGPTESTKQDSAARKPSNRAGSQRTEPTTSNQESDEDSNDDGTSQPQKKKKKRIFASAQPTTFDWSSFQKGNDLLNIPTELSPVKSTEKVPPRSVFGRVGSVLGLR